MLWKLLIMIFTRNIGMIQNSEKISSDLYFFKEHVGKIMQVNWKRLTINKVGRAILVKKICNITMVFDIGNERKG